MQATMTPTQKNFPAILLLGGLALLLVGILIPAGLNGRFTEAASFLKFAAIIALAIVIISTWPRAIPIVKTGLLATFAAVAFIAAIAIPFWVIFIYHDTLTGREIIQTVEAIRHIIGR